MTPPIISTAEANRLNGIIQSTLDNRLFMFCNYEPTMSLAVSEQGRFLLAVQDLYKFAIDSCFVLKNHNWCTFIPKRMQSNYSRIDEIVAFISGLRSAIDHNQSVANGWLEQQYIASYKEWLLAVISKEAAECEEDYFTLCLELETIADELIRITEMFAYQFSSQTDKQRIIDNWVSETLKWYTTSKQDIYRSQMIDAYIARIEGKGKIIKDLSRATMFNRTTRWIKKKYHYPFLQEKEKLLSDIKQLENALLPNNKELDYLFTGLSDSEKEKFKEGIQHELEEKKQKLKVLNKELLNSGIDPVNEFFSHLSDQIRLFCTDGG